MAGLFVVSAFLFRGGRGAWQQFLSVAADWVWNLLHVGADPGEIILWLAGREKVQVSFDGPTDAVTRLRGASRAM